MDANLELNVTPQITSRDPKEVGKQIMMKVRATRNAVGARSNPAGPSIDRREANTQVLIRDGETMVIGGVFIDTQGNSVSGIPYLSCACVGMALQAEDRVCIETRAADLLNAQYCEEPVANVLALHLELPVRRLSSPVYFNHKQC